MFCAYVNLPVRGLLRLGRGYVRTDTRIPSVSSQVDGATHGEHEGSQLDKTIVSVIPSVCIVLFQSRERLRTFITDLSNHSVVHF